MVRIYFHSNVNFLPLSGDRGPKGEKGDKGDRAGDAGKDILLGLLDSGAAGIQAAPNV